AGIHQWIRLAEVMAADASEDSWRKIGIDPNGLEHRTWLESGDQWMQLTESQTLRSTEPHIPERLRRRVAEFCGQSNRSPLGILIERPAPKGMTDAFADGLREISGDVNIFHVSGAECAVAASMLARELGRDSQRPAWLDAVPPIEIEIRKKNNPGTRWPGIISENERIPAGELYVSRDRDDQTVGIAPGVNEICLHLRRGSPRKEKYSRVPIRPSEHRRHVRAIARTRPLSGEVQIQIVEDHDDGQHRPVSRVRWSELHSEKPKSLMSIPELYIFPANEDKWQELERLLREVVQRDAWGQKIPIDLKDRLYVTTQGQWKRGEFPLGSDGKPPRFKDSSRYKAVCRLLKESTDILTRDLENYVRNGDGTGLDDKSVNRLHMALTWLFVGCPELPVKILLEAIRSPGGSEGRALRMMARPGYVAWSIYSGFGRAVKGEAELRVAFDELITRWERDRNGEQDRFLLAAVTHPLARRLSATNVLNEDRDRFERVKGFLDRHLENLMDNRCDRRAGGKRPSLELKYITMGYRGLCQVRYKNPEWFPTDSESAKRIHAQLLEATAERNRNQELVEKSAPYLIGEGEDPTMPYGF
ncbi:MAG: hypothetical protein OXC91_11560, partial [Rhodobacteraceae bacterium]|nr:hypothetical protein [Paracoccaceae bacterium]